MTTTRQEEGMKWPEITMRGCPRCGRVVATSAKNAETFQHFCEETKDFMFGGLVPVSYVPAVKGRSLGSGEGT